MIGRIITRGWNSSLKCLSTGSLPPPPFPFPFLTIFPQTERSRRQFESYSPTPSPDHLCDNIGEYWYIVNGHVLALFSWITELLLNCHKEYTRLVTKKRYLTIIPWAGMGSESIAHEAGGRMGYWLRGHEGERNNCLSKIQLVGQKYRE